MALMSEGKYEEKLERLGQQLFQTESLLQTHPLVSEKLLVLQTVVRFFCLQTDWAVAGSLARFSMTLETALQGDRHSATAFIGPALHEMQLAFSRLVQTVFTPADKKNIKLIHYFSEVMTLAVVYLSTQTLGHWKRVFPTDNPGTIKQSGLLLRELGLTFILGASILEIPYKIIGQQLGLSEKKQRILGHLGLSYLILILILVNEQDEPLHEDFFELIAKFLGDAFPSLEEALQEADRRSLIKADVAFSQLELLRQAKLDPQALKEALIGSFEAFGLPYEEVRKDIKKLIDVSENLYESFSHIFFQVEQSVTSMTQSA